MSPQSQPLLTRSPLFAVVFFGLFLFFLYQMGRILMVFISPLLWAAILTLTLYPLQKQDHRPAQTPAGTGGRAS